VDGNRRIVYLGINFSGWTVGATFHSISKYEGAGGRPALRAPMPIVRPFLSPEPRLRSRPRGFPVPFDRRAPFALLQEAPARSVQTLSLRGRGDRVGNDLHARGRLARARCAGARPRTEGPHGRGALCERGRAARVHTGRGDLAGRRRHPVVRRDEERALAAEAVVVFDPTLAGELAFRRKRADTSGRRCGF